MSTGTEPSIKGKNQGAKDNTDRNLLLHHPKVQRMLGGGILERMGINILSNVQLQIMSGHKIPSDMKLIRKTKRAKNSLLTGDENFTILSFARGFAHREGAFIEIGTYQGCSARLICSAKGDKKFYVCDTFEGLPKSHEKDKAVHHLNQYACSEETVGAFLSEFPNVQLVKGFFPDSAAGVIPEDERFAFAHIDVDLYEGTLHGIEYLYPRMISGGVIISHDFSILAGVRNAVYEFMKAHPEASMVELPSTQCMIIKP